MLPSKKFFKDKSIEQIIRFGKETPSGISGYYLILIRRLTGLTYDEYKDISLQDLKSEFGPFLNAKFVLPDVKKNDITLQDIQKAVKESINMDAVANYLGVLEAVVRERLKNLLVFSDQEKIEFKFLESRLSNMLGNKPSENQSAYLVLMSLTPLKIYSAYKRQNSNVIETAKELGITTEELNGRLSCFVVDGEPLTLERLKAYFEKTKEASAAAELLPADLDQAAIMSGEEALNVLGNSLSPERNKSKHGSEVSTLQTPSDEVPILSGEEALNVLSNLLSPKRDKSKHGSEVSPVASSPLSGRRPGLFSPEQKRKGSDVDSSQTDSRKKKPFR